MTRHVANILVALCFVLIVVSAVRAGDEDCVPEPASIWAPAGVSGCSLDGPTSGKASTYPGSVAAANWCTHPWTDCGMAQVQSHLTGLEITVPVGMYCHCFWMSDRRLIDLTASQVRALGLDPADGIFAVTVTPLIEGASSAVLPDTRMVGP